MLIFSRLIGGGQVAEGRLPVEGLHGGDDADERGVAPDERVQSLRRHLLLEARQQDVLHHSAPACRHASWLLFSRGPPSSVRLWLVELWFAFLLLCSFAGLFGQRFYTRSESQLLQLRNDLVIGSVRKQLDFEIGW